MAVNHVKIPGVDNALQLPVGPEIVPGEGRAAEGDGEIVVAIGDNAVLGIIVVVFCGDGSLPAGIVQHFEIGNMKLYNVGLDHRGNKKHFFSGQKNSSLYQSLALADAQ